MIAYPKKKKKKWNNFEIVIVQKRKKKKVDFLFLGIIHYPREIVAIQYSIIFID